MPPAVIEVAFKGNRKEFFLWEPEALPSPRTPVIVEADRGEDLGHVHAIGDLARQRARGTPHGIGDESPARKARRVASAEDVRRYNDLRSQDEDARRKAMERVRANALSMKVSDAEWQWDRKKLTFYFTAEKRVDFRTLVRELAAQFRTRIELKQIGVRDEAKRLDGIGRCGRQYCSASWLPELRPVSLGVAKDQRLSLNPTQISGACGRLMCSLRYEHEFYVQARRRFPKEGKIVRSSVGEERVVANDIFRERVVLRNAEGESRTVALADLLREIDAAGGSMTPAVPDRTERPERAERADRADRHDVAEAARAPVEVEEQEESGDDEIEESVTAEPDSGAPASIAGAADQEGGEKRPHRRRGRRGGRRNRGRRNGGPGGGAPGPGTGGPPNGSGGGQRGPGTPA